jgi:CRP-like cAMP-binding protein
VAVNTVGPGDILGEMALLLGGDHSADVRSLTDVVALEIPYERIERLFAEQPLLAAKLYRNLAAVLAARLQHTSLWVKEAPPL